MTIKLERLPLYLVLGASLAACSDSDGPTGGNGGGDCDAGASACAATLGADITANRTLHADTVYTLTDFVHVKDGATLTIQPGTVIKGQIGSALFVLPGAKIEARGRADAPIVFTSAEPVGSRRPGDWGGLILIGNGVINRTGEVQLEGTNTGGNNYKLAYSGGTDNADDSGTLEYVRVEFAGFGPAPDQELNSFTFAAVGSGTTLSHLQALNGLDDHYEWFGGAVDGKYLVSYESGDDHFDASEGYVGRNQFLVAYQSGVLKPRPGSGDVSGDPQGFEVDGCAGSGCASQDAEPLTDPLFANFTLVGTGPNDAVSAKSGGVGMVIRRGAAGQYVNGVVARWPRAGISLRDATTQALAASGRLALRNIYLAEVGADFEGGSGRFTVDAAANAIVSGAGTAASLFSALPSAATPPSSATAFDWTPASGAAIATSGTGSFTGALATKGGSFVTGTDYAGAAAPTGPKWWQGWTYYEAAAGQN
ncbi:MAG TPA: hypothetical protein VFX39_01120 [Gemmatimonadaceae bacterium]|nr:hypothetical protein [Gemmatimonadaceae bacterium]